jgi:hypothetical protein
VATRRVVLIRARYDFAEAGEPGLGVLVDTWLVALRRP